MKAARVLAAVCLGIGALFILGGCFFVRPPQITGPALLVGHLLCGVGEETEIPVEVLDFPAPGVAGLAILDLRYDPSVLEIQGIQGQNGFQVLCACVDNRDGRVKFIAVNPTEGISSGPVATLKVRRLSPQDPRFSLASSALELVDASNVKIPSGNFSIQLGGAPRYFATRGK
jgi:hypothetical protein